MPTRSVTVTKNGSYVGDGDGNNVGEGDNEGGNEGEGDNEGVKEVPHSQSVLQLGAPMTEEQVPYSPAVHELAQKEHLAP
mmetsp:Transcript_36178/g.73614  ORF Transcript_36178/g.73614 Transcript_36178/m.73614 type:complete len:80 (-) Transcript_36178:927-1166(-)